MFYFLGHLSVMALGIIIMFLSLILTFYRLFHNLWTENTGTAGCCCHPHMTKIVLQRNSERLKRKRHFKNAHLTLPHDTVEMDSMCTSSWRRPRPSVQTCLALREMGRQVVALAETNLDMETRGQAERWEGGKLGPGWIWTEGDVGIQLLCVPTPGPGWPISRDHIWRHFICWRMRTSRTWNWEVRCDQTGTSIVGWPHFPLCVAINLLSPDDNAELFSSRYSQKFLTTAVIFGIFLVQYQLSRALTNAAFY